MKKIIVAILVLFILAGCNSYPFCQKAIVPGVVVDKTYREAYTTSSMDPHQSCSGSGKTRSCHTYYTYSTYHHPAVWSLVFTWNDKRYEREVGQGVYDNTKIGDWFNFDVCQDEIPTTPTPVYKG